MTNPALREEWMKDVKTMADRFIPILNFYTEIWSRCFWIYLKILSHICSGSLVWGLPWGTVLPRREAPTTGSTSLTRSCLDLPHILDKIKNLKNNILKTIYSIKQNLIFSDLPDWNVLLHWHDPRASWRNYQEPLCIPHKGEHEPFTFFSRD